MGEGTDVLDMIVREIFIKVKWKNGGPRDISMKKSFAAPSERDYAITWYISCAYPYFFLQDISHCL